MYTASEPLCHDDLGRSSSTSCTRFALGTSSGHHDVFINCMLFAFKYFHVFMETNLDQHNIGLTVLEAGAMIALATMGI